MAPRRYELRSVVPMSKDGASGRLLTFDRIGGGEPVVIHLTEEQYEEAVVRFPLERLAEETERLRERGDKA